MPRNGRRPESALNAFLGPLTQWLVTRLPMLLLAVWSAVSDQTASSTRFKIMGLQTIRARPMIIGCWKA